MVLICIALPKDCSTDIPFTILRTFIKVDMGWLIKQISNIVKR